MSQQSAYLLETICAIIVENFGTTDWVPLELLYGFRVVFIAPQQLVYAWVFSSKRTGRIVEHFLEFHTATIMSSGGRAMVRVNTTFNRLMLETILHNSGKTVASGIEGGKTVASGLEGGITSGLQVGKKSASSVSNILINDVNIFVLSHAVGISSMIGKTIGTVVQAVLFTPVAFFVWVPVNFLQNNYFTELINSKIFASVALYSVLVISPFVYFQGTPNATVSTWVVRGHVLIVETLCAIGISKNRSDPQLLIVDGPKDHVRTNFRNLLAYGTVLVELWQIPLLAVTASHLTTRYSGGDFSGPQAQRSLAVGDYVLHFVFDDLFLLQYPMALLGVFLWMLIFCCSEAVAIVYRKAFDSLINKFQLVLYGLSGPGYIFIVKNLMRPLFCVHRDGYSDTPYRVAAHKQFPCWGPVHLNLCAVSLFCLCVFLPSATLTNAIRFSAPEDIRYVYYFLRFEVYVKGSMVFLSLATQFASDPETMSYKVEQYISLMILILGSISLMLVVRLMQPCCQKHIHRLKYFLHCCSIWVCLTCMVVVLTDNKSWQLHVAWVLVGWFLCGIGFVAFEVQHQKQDIFGQESTERVIDVCLNDIEHLQTVIATKFRTWETHSFILRLLKFCQHDNSEIAKKGHETLAVLSYLDQMTQQDTFFAFAPNTCVQMLCATISQHEDERVRSFAVRTLKTFLQEDRYVREISVYTDTPESSVGEPLAAIMRESRQLVTKIDAAICLLALCSVDSNQLAAVVDLLPILTDWVSNGSIVMQHLALELITSLSTRFDLCLPIISEGCLEAMFELCLAIDATSNGRYKDGLEQNTSNGFRKGFKQPDRCENLAHQLPRNVLQDFCTHFETVEDMINNLSSNELDTSGKPSKLISLDQSQGMHRLRSLDHALSTDSVQYSSDDMRDSASSSHSPEPQHRNPLSAGAPASFVFAPICIHLMSSVTVGSTVTRRKKAKRAITRVIDTKPKTPQMSINVDDFIAWIQSGSFLSEQIKEKWISQMNGAKGSSIVELTENSLKELFDAIDDDKSGDLDEVEIATFLEDLGLGSRDDLQRLLLDTGVRQRGLGEISSAGTSTLEIDKGDFRHWIRNGVRKDGLARAMVKQCLGETINESTLDDNMIDQLFAEIDEDGGGTLDSDELATFLEAEGLGGQAELEQMLKEEIVGKSVVDTVVQMSAKQIRVIKSEMNSFILHIIMELATGMSGMGRRQLIKSGAVDVILLGLRGDNQKGTRLVALQALHALMSDKFALEDVMADKEFEGYYADLLQLSGQAHASNHELDLVFTDLSPKQRRKVHMVAQFTGMKHRSSGPPDKRLVTVTSAPDNNAVQTLNGGKLNSIAGSWDKKMSKSLDLEDPFDYQFYNNNRDMVATNELLGVLTVMAADMAADDQITFHAWDVIVLCVKYDAISPDKTEQIWRICIQVVLQHPTVAVAVLASWALDYIISRKTHLFEQKKGIAKFQSAGRRIMMGIRVARAWRSVNAGGEIDEGVQKTRTTLR
eukprot:SAG31_NODE_627_length_13445_cov_18.311053_4_plen_1494_part_00